LVFASSMVAMLPPPPTEMLDESSPTADYIPYGKSKALGEQMVKEFADRLPSIVLRIGGVFSDWCELPPLASLINLWGRSGPLSRLVVGQGNTGHPYLHRHDFVRLLRCCIEKNEDLRSHEVFLASQHGAVLHNDLFPLIRKAVYTSKSVEPIFVPAAVAKLGLALQLVWGGITRNMPYERLWMLDYVDRPWVADTTHTRGKLNWDCSEGMGICDRLPRMLERFVNERSQWERRNQVRNKGNYAYLADK
jgi:nucleoside-diphosphate-sugar epimerase